MAFNYNNLTLSELTNKIENSRFWDLPKMVAEVFKRFLARFSTIEQDILDLQNAPSGGLESLTGDSVDNSDPLNPIINAIPLTGTEVGSPVTGDISYATLDGVTRKINFLDANGKEQSILFGSLNGIGLLNGISLKSINNEDNSSSIGADINGSMMEYINSDLSIIRTVTLSQNGLRLTESGVTSKGVYSDIDHSSVDPTNKLIYAQRAYVDRANSYSTDETLTGGTWIDGKPIYRKFLIIDNTDEHITSQSINFNDYITDLDYILPTQLYKDSQGGQIFPNGRFVSFEGNSATFYTDITGLVGINVPIDTITIILEYTKNN